MKAKIVSTILVLGLCIAIPNMVSAHTSERSSSVLYIHGTFYDYGDIFISDSSEKWNMTAFDMPEYSSGTTGTVVFDGYNTSSFKDDDFITSYPDNSVSIPYPADYIPIEDIAEYSDVSGNIVLYLKDVSYRNDDPKDLSYSEILKTVSKR